MGVAGMLLIVILGGRVGVWLCDPCSEACAPPLPVLWSAPVVVVPRIVICAQDRGENADE
jgi:hypothetical protein